MDLKGFTKLGCGGCGSEGVYSLYQKDGELFVQCGGCRSVSRIVPEARFSIEWTEGSEGRLAPVPS